MRKIRNIDGQFQLGVTGNVFTKAVAGLYAQARIGIAKAGVAVHCGRVVGMNRFAMHSERSVKLKIERRSAGVCRYADQEDKCLVFVLHADASFFWCP
jgi:hypothetical protein